MNKYLLLILLWLLVVQLSFAQERQTVTVGLEPFPPFINGDGNGLTVDMFREIERVTDLKFDVNIMTYARAKYQLSRQKLTIAGHTPKNLESDDFYQYAIELDWQIDTTSDLFVFDKKYFDLSSVETGRIGTTTGNAGFFSKLLAIEASRFTEVKELNHLVSMFVSGRLDVMLFERASVMTLLQQRKVHGVYYKSIGQVPASIAVANTEQGKQLKAKLDKAIRQLDTKKIFASYLIYAQLPDTGKVPEVK